MYKQRLRGVTYSFSYIARLEIGGETFVLDLGTGLRNGILEIIYAASPMSIHLESYEYRGSRLQRRIWDLKRVNMVP